MNEKTELVLCSTNSDNDPQVDIIDKKTEQHRDRAVRHQDRQKKRQSWGYRLALYRRNPRNCGKTCRRAYG